MAFRRGAEEAEKASAQKTFHKTEFLSLEPDQVVDLRYLEETSQWITVLMHTMVMTKGNPDAKGKWPEKMPAVCRKEVGEECYICEHMRVDGKPYKSQARTWTQALVRVKQEPGGQWMDATETITEEGKPDVVVPKIVIVNFAWSNYFANLSNSNGMYGTVLDRDYRVRRQGKEIKTEYFHAPHDRVMVAGKDGPEVWDLRDPKFMEPYKPFLLDMDKIVADRCSDDYYARYFDPTKPIPTGGNSNSGSTEVAPPVDESQYSGLMDRLQPPPTYGNG